MLRCIHCNLEVEVERKHENNCPYNPENVRKIVYYLKSYVLEHSELSKCVKPFPTVFEFDNFCEVNRIMRVVTIRRNYLVNEGISFEDWLTEILEYALHRDIITSVEFPYFLQFVYDAWLFLSKEEYAKRYAAALMYEDGEFEVDEGKLKELARRIKNGN